MAKPPDLIGSREACELLDVVRSTLVRWVDAGTIKPWLRLPNGSYLFDRAVIEAKVRERAA